MPDILVSDGNRNMNEWIMNARKIFALVESQKIGDESLFISTIDEAPIGFENELTRMEIKKLIFSNGNIHAHGNESHCHTQAERIINYRIVSGFFKIGMNPVISNMGVMIPRIYTCGHASERYPDIQITKGPHDSLDYNLVAGEIAFSHESEAELLAECVHFLTRYTTSRYSIGMKIRYGLPFHSRLFLLGRLPSNQTDEHQLKMLRSKGDRKSRRCDQNIPKSDFKLDKDFLANLGISLLFLETIDETNYNHDRVIRLPEFGVDVQISAEDFASIRNYVHERFSENE